MKMKQHHPMISEGSVPDSCIAFSPIGKHELGVTGTNM